MQRRCIPPIVVEWLDRFGSRTRHKGAEVRFFDKRSRRALERHLGSAVYRRVEDYLDTYAVIGEGRQVITVAHRQQRLKRP